MRCTVRLFRASRSASQDPPSAATHERPTPAPTPAPGALPAIPASAVDLLQPLELCFHDSFCPQRPISLHFTGNDASNRSSIRNPTDDGDGGVGGGDQGYNELVLYDPAPQLARPLPPNFVVEYGMIELYPDDDHAWLSADSPLDGSLEGSRPAANQVQPQWETLDDEKADDHLEDHWQQQPPSFPRRPFPTTTRRWLGRGARLWAGLLVTGAMYVALACAVAVFCPRLVCDNNSTSCSNVSYASPSTLSPLQSPHKTLAIDKLTFTQTPLTLMDDIAALLLESTLDIPAALLGMPSGFDKESSQPGSQDPNTRQEKESEGIDDEAEGQEHEETREEEVRAQEKTVPPEVHLFTDMSEVLSDICNILGVYERNKHCDEAGTDPDPDGCDISAMPVSDVGRLCARSPALASSVARLWEVGLVTRFNRDVDQLDYWFRLMMALKQRQKQPPAGWGEECTDEGPFFLPDEDGAVWTGPGTHAPTDGSGMGSETLGLVGLHRAMASALDVLHPHLHPADRVNLTIWPGRRSGAEAGHESDGAELGAATAQSWEQQRPAEGDPLAGMPHRW